jgi:hypothetical protein
MSRRLDMTKAEAAFKRAAHKAVHGTREERSGRFMPKQGGETSFYDRPLNQPDAPLVEIHRADEKNVICECCSLHLR